MRAHIIDELRPVAPDIDPGWEAQTMREILEDSRRGGELTVKRRRHKSAQFLLAVVAVGVILGGLVVARDLLPGREVGPAGPPREPGVASTAPDESKAQLAEAQLLGRWGADPATAQELRLPWLRFDYDGTVTGFDSCNSVGGAWELDRSARTVAVDIRGTTSVACPDAIQPRLDELGFDGTALTYELRDGTSKTMVAADDEPQMYLIGARSKLLEAVPAPVYPDGKSTTPQQRAVTAVKELMKVEFTDGAKYSSFWGKICRLGDEVKSVDSLSSERVVLVTFARRGGELCDIVRGGDDLRSQQLAWTVVTNLGVDDTTVVRLVGPDQKPLADDIVARRFALASEDR